MDESFVTIALTDGTVIDDVRAVFPEDVPRFKEMAVQVDDGVMQWQIMPLQEADGVIYFLNE